MPARRAPWPDHLPDVFVGSELVAQGALTKAQLRDPRVRRLFVDVYAPRHLEPDHGLRCRGASLVVPPSARLTGRSMATVLGARLRSAGDPVEFVVPHRDRRPGPAGTTLRGAVRGPLGHGCWKGVALASPERMAFDLAAGHHEEDAVAHLDAALGLELFEKAAVGAWLLGRHEDHVVGARTAVALADGRAGSPPESRLRVRLVRAELGVTFEPQHVVTHLGRFLARVDLAIVDLKIAIEYEGAWHGLLAEQLARDRERLDRLREAGWIVVHVTAETMRDRGAAVDAVRRAIAQRRS
ncbi:hypothetical protein FHN55_11360 [Streptomyces sp. NP160]|uniref:endonuclease domain-containing protein n=1 Tax=Streptomyces sp. NP160 TaxID=2586637 RepID=UPI00111923DD|nr:hypothetical protein [Streptomyces sp. NP160]TNM67116.1 hypothetical protein FHN55_11360 [Streptomyces sp. NP160]